MPWPKGRPRSRRNRGGAVGQGEPEVEESEKENNVISRLHPVVSTPVKTKTSTRNPKFRETTSPSPIARNPLTQLDQSPVAEINSPTPPSKRRRREKPMQAKPRRLTSDNGFGELDVPYVCTVSPLIGVPRRSSSPAMDMQASRKMYDFPVPPSKRRRQRKGKKADVLYQAAFKEWADKMNAEFERIEKIPLNITVVKGSEHGT